MKSGNFSPPTPDQLMITLRARGFALRSRFVFPVILLGVVVFWVATLLSEAVFSSTTNFPAGANQFSVVVGDLKTADTHD